MRGKNFACIATIMPDGTRQISPVWIDHEGEIVLVNTSIRRVKQRDLGREPRVAVAVADQNDAYEKVLTTGRALSQTTQGADEHIDRLAKKYLGRDRYP